MERERERKEREKRGREKREGVCARERERKESIQKKEKHRKTNTRGGRRPFLSDSLIPSPRRGTGGNGIKRGRW